MEHLPLRRVEVVTPGITEISHDELREEGEVEADERKHCSKPPEPLRVELARDLWPPEVHAAQKSENRAANHDVVEVRDHEIGVVQVNVCCERSQVETGQAADCEEPDEAEGVEHRRGKPDAPLID